MGSGKSTVGPLVARGLGLPFVDLDAELVQLYGPIPDQFANEGEAVFRARERDLVAALCDRDEPIVVATGGGTWAHQPSRRRLRERFVTVVLTAPLSVLEHRVGGGEDRPRWNAGAAALLASRQEAYADADRVVATGDRGPAEVAAEIVAWVRGNRCP